MEQQQPNAASVALVRDGCVLLIQRAREPLARLWTLPGGRLEPGETAEAAAVREVAEELGLAASDLLAVTEIVPAPGWRLAVFATISFGGTPVPSSEVAGWRWATIAEAGALPTTPGLLPVLELALQRCARSD